jgi:hypothetical protein
MEKIIMACGLCFLLSFLGGCNGGNATVNGIGLPCKSPFAQGNDRANLPDQQV